LILICNSFVWFQQIDCLAMSGINDFHTSTGIQMSNDSRKINQSGANVHGGFTFPAPATDLQKHAVASTQGYPGLWAYTSNSAVVVVKSADLPR